MSGLQLEYFHFVFTLRIYHLPEIRFKYPNAARYIDSTDGVNVLEPHPSQISCAFPHNAAKIHISLTGPITASDNVCRTTL